MSVLVAENLIKYSKNIPLINDFSYNFLDNQIYGFINSDANYQSELLKVLSGKESVDQGSVYLDGELLYKNDTLKERICYISKDTYFASGLSAKNIFDIMASIYPKWDDIYAYDLCRHFNISLESKFTKMNQLKREIFLGIIAIAAKANITVLDNVLMYSSVKDYYDFFNYLYKYHENYKSTFIIATSRIDEISYLFDKFLFFDKANLFEAFTFKRLQSSFKYLSGKSEVLKSLIGGVKIIGFEERKKKLIVCVSKRLTKDEKRKFQKYLINISDVPISNIFVYLLQLREMKEDI